MAIPSRVDQVEDKQRRFYIFTTSTIYVELQKEALRRGTDLWTLCGAVLTDWINSGCPDTFNAESGETPK